MHPQWADYAAGSLRARDAVGGDILNLTQEFLSHMLLLCVRRTRVCDGANKVRAEGLIKYKRSIIRILDCKSLEKRSCECRAVMRAAVTDIMPEV